VASANHQVRLWTAAAAQPLPVGTGFTGVRKLVVRDGGVLAVYDWGELSSISVEDGRVVEVASLPFLRRPGPMGYDQPGRHLAQAQFDGGGVTVFEVGPPEPQEIAFVQGPAGIAHAVALDPPAEHLAVVVGTQLSLWRLAEPEVPVAELSGLPTAVTHVLVGQDADWIGSLAPTGARFAACARRP
jgi:hypothetical protein